MKGIDSWIYCRLCNGTVPSAADTVKGTDLTTRTARLSRGSVLAGVIEFELTILVEEVVGSLKALFT